MAAVIAARFDTFAAADSAAHALFALGVESENVDVFFASTPPVPALSEALDADRLSVRYRAQANVSVLATLGAVFGAAVVMTLDGPALVMLACGALGAFLGAWVGAMWLATRNRVKQVEQEDWVALLTARVPATQAPEVVQILSDAGGRHIEQARGAWQHGRWVDSTRGVSVSAALRGLHGRTSHHRKPPAAKPPTHSTSARTPFAG